MNYPCIRYIVHSLSLLLTYCYIARASHLCISVISPFGGERGLQHWQNIDKTLMSHSLPPFILPSITHCLTLNAGPPSYILYQLLNAGPPSYILYHNISVRLCVDSHVYNPEAMILIALTVSVVWIVCCPRSCYSWMIISINIKIWQSNFIPIKHNLHQLSFDIVTFDVT
jgi:hypothetical protein